MDDGLLLPGAGDFCQSFLPDLSIRVKVDVDSFQQPFCGVHSIWNLHANRCEIACHVRDRPGVTQLTLSQEVDLVEQIKRLGRGLVDGSDDQELMLVIARLRSSNLVLSGYRFQIGDDLVGGYTIQPTRGLVEKENLWRSNKLTCNRGSALLTTAQTFLNRGSDDNISLL